MYIRGNAEQSTRRCADGGNGGALLDDDDDDGDPRPMGYGLARTDCARARAVQKDGGGTR